MLSTVTVCDVIAVAVISPCIPASPVTTRFPVFKLPTTSALVAVIAPSVVTTKAPEPILRLPASIFPRSLLIADKSSTVILSAPIDPEVILSASKLVTVITEASIVPAVILLAVKELIFASVTASSNILGVVIASSVILSVTTASSCMSAVAVGGSPMVNA